jgi:hypothetical protein
MAFFERQDIARLYVLRIELPDNTVVHKIGITRSDRATDRMLEILRSWFVKYRFVPYTEIRLDIQSHNAQDTETYLHRILKTQSFAPHEKVSGGTEMFIGLDEAKLLTFIRAYESSSYIKPPKLTDKECEVICKLLVIQTS